jgi:hypothetical protein
MAPFKTAVEAGDKQMTQAVRIARFEMSEVGRETVWLK